MKRHLNLALALSLLPLASVVAQELVIKPGHPQGRYQPGQPIQWHVQFKGSNVSEASYVIKKGGLTEVKKGTVKLVKGEADIETTSNEPGWLLAEVTVRPPGDKSVKGLGGALIAPEKITRAEPRPQDFDAFWAGKIKDLQAIPANPKLEPAEGGKSGVDYFKITMDNIRGSHIRGQLARPQKEGKLPAMLIVQWAGVYPLQKGWVTERAAEGWLCLNINAHDLPIDQPEAFYKEKAANELKDYPAIGNEDRETAYFLRMYLSCFRAAQYLTERADWDGQTLVVNGGSQGGLQSFVTAALHPKVTAIMANVPAGCDLNGPVAGRMAGWPMWYWATKGKDEAKVRAADRYYDVVNFASRIKCPVLVGVGLIDTTCPSPGVFAAFNEVSAPKEIVLLPVAEHGEKKGSHAPYYARFNAWKDALVKGKPAPVK